MEVLCAGEQVGGLLCGLLGDRVGRKKATLYAVIGMTAATVLQGCLPSKKTGGPVAQYVGVMLLFVCRVVQVRDSRPPLTCTLREIIFCLGFRGSI